MNRCMICKVMIQPTEKPYEYKGVEQPTFAHELCHWKATAGMLAKQLSAIEVTIETGNATVQILAMLLLDLIEYAEMGANWSLANHIETDLKKIDWMQKRINDAKKICDQFRQEIDKKKDVRHICTPQCRH